MDGHWGRWSDWTKCDAKCDNGKRKRIRVCDNPPKKHSGKDCPGNSVEEEVCITKRCHLGEDFIDLVIFSTPYILTNTMKRDLISRLLIIIEIDLFIFNANCCHAITDSRLVARNLKLQFIDMICLVVFSL